MFKFKFKCIVHEPLLEKVLRDLGNIEYLVTMWLFVDVDDGAELDVALGTYKSLVGIFKDGIVHLGDGNFKHHTGG